MYYLSLQLEIRSFTKWYRQKKNLKVWKQTRLEEVKRVGDEWIAKVNVEGQGMKTVRSKVMIDATELGDVAKMCSGI